MHGFSNHCMIHITQLKNRLCIAACAVSAPALLVAVSACGNQKVVADNDSLPQHYESFHADNDIAMTVRSLVDAVRVGEQLDSAIYNFTGILTDGQGTPLYTDVEGAPGEWSVRVESTDDACIRNLYVGDLMSDDLQSYILNSLNLNNADLVTAYANPDNEEEIIRLFDIGDVKISFATAPAMTSSGLQGSLMTIRVNH